MATRRNKEYTPVAFISFSNDAIELSRERRGEILPPSKARYRYLPAAKIARLGVDKKFQRKNIGTLFINMAKQLFLMDNRTVCRFMTVDAYNPYSGKNFAKYLFLKGLQRFIKISSRRKMVQEYYT